ncbi:MAG: helix-turn-helix-type transcriptional regulator, partial [Bacteroidetes bacterium]|nr:helix-turn-helix-type transcriptional regulator [Bacteroidota bacterium]
GAQLLVTGYQIIGQDLVFPENVQQLNYIRDVKDLLEELEPVYQEI